MRSRAAPQARRGASTWSFSKLSGPVKGVIRDTQVQNRDIIPIMESRIEEIMKPDMETELM